MTARPSKSGDQCEAGAGGGGNTITQQLAKNCTGQKSLARKLREALVTRWLENDLSKVRILTLYLNLIEWGDGIYGCEAAARTWFGKACADLSPDEAAGLAGMIPNPRRINPRVNAARYERAKKRVLWLMANAGYLEKSVAGLGSAPPPKEPDLEEEPDPAVATEPPLAGEEAPVPHAPPTKDPL
jgi:monofunctional biosynthetic peptidoglycan transglycosylase